MRVYGLTGGIASGKSTVARLLGERGAAVIDADELAREVVAPGQPAYREIVETFGPEVLCPDGTLDRKALGARVFADPELRRRLNAITHPRIAALSAERLAALAARGVPIAFYEAALLVENRIHEGLAGLVVVACDEATQLARVMARDGLDEAAARARIAAQLPLAAKVAVADHVIDNSGDLSATAREVDELWRRLSEAA
jgi:dephospho-CoA kinase